MELSLQESIAEVSRVAALVNETQPTWAGHLQNLLSALRPPAVAPEGEAVAEIEDSDASGEGKYVKWLVPTLSLEAGDFLYLHPAPPAGASEGAVGEVRDEMRGEDGAAVHYVHLLVHLPVGTKLYTHPSPPQAQAAGLLREARAMIASSPNCYKICDECDCGKKEFVARIDALPSPPAAKEPKRYVYPARDDCPHGIRAGEACFYCIPAKEQSEGARVVYQCPRCATSMEIDPSAKPSGK